MTHEWLESDSIITYKTMHKEERVFAQSRTARTMYWDDGSKLYCTVHAGDRSIDKEKLADELRIELHRAREYPMHQAPGRLSPLLCKEDIGLVACLLWDKRIMPGTLLDFPHPSDDYRRVVTSPAVISYWLRELGGIPVTRGDISKDLRDERASR